MIYQETHVIDGQPKVTNTYVISYDNENIIINGKKMKVVWDSEYTYKLQKTQIRAFNGAEGLYNWLERASRYNETMVTQVCAHAVEHGKPV